MSARSRKLGYAIFRAFHVPVFLRFLLIYPPGFVILCRIRSNRKDRGGNKEERIGGEKGRIEAKNRSRR